MHATLEAPPHSAFNGISGDQLDIVQALREITGEQFPVTDSVPGIDDMHQIVSVKMEGTDRRRKFTGEIDLREPTKEELCAEKAALRAQRQKKREDQRAEKAEAKAEQETKKATAKAKEAKDNFEFRTTGKPNSLNNAREFLRRLVKAGTFLGATAAHTNVQTVPIFTRLS